MLHSLPALLNEVEQKLMNGDDLLPLLAGIRWAEVIDWPRSRAEADQLQRRLDGIRFLVNGLHAPVRATLMRLTQSHTYAARGGASLPGSISLRLSQSV